VASSSSVSGPVEVSSRAGTAGLDTTAVIGRRRLRSGLAPPVVGALLALPSFVWISLDRSIWPWDPAWYGQVSIDLWATWRHSPGLWKTSMLNAFGIKPPAIAWFGQLFVPLGGVFGSVQTALLVFLVATQAVSLALVFAAARRIAGGRTFLALPGALLTAGAPLFVALSHDYWVEPIQTLSVVWVLFIMVSARRWHPSLTVAQLVAAVSFGLLAKLATPLYMAAPAAVAFVFSISALRSRAWGRWWLEKRFAASALAAALLAYGTARWYELNFASAWRQARYSAESTLYGANRPFFSKLDLWLHKLGDAVFLPYFDVALAVTLVVGAVAFFVLRRNARSVRESAYPLLVLLGCVGTPIAALVSLSTQANEDGRFLLPTIPAVGLALVALLRVVDSRIVAGVIALLFAGQFALSTLQSFDTGTPRELMYVRLRAPAAKSAFAAELDRVVRLTCTNDTAGQVTMVGTDYPWLNANTLELLAHARFQAGPHCSYTALGYALNDSGVAWQRVIDYGSPFLVTVDYGNPRNPLPPEFVAQTDLTDPFNEINVAVLRRAISSGRYTIVPGSRRVGVIVLRLAG
jgi:hypothetical protein